MEPADLLRAITPVPFEVSVACGGEEHAIEIRDGVAHQRAHAALDERTLAVIGGTLPACMRFVDAVRRSPGALWRIDDLLAGAATSWPANPAFLRQRVRARWGALGDDALDMPQVLRRLGVLAAIRADPAAMCTPQRLNEILKLRGSAAFRADGRVGPFVVLSLAGDVEVGPPSGRVMWIGVPARWLATTYLLGLESVEGGFTLDTTLPDAADGQLSIRQMCVDGDMLRGVLRTAPVRDVLPGIRLGFAREEAR